VAIESRFVTGAADSPEHAAIASAAIGPAARRRIFTAENYTGFWSA